jgi:hypothetical protein
VNIKRKKIFNLEFFLVIKNFRLRVLLNKNYLIRYFFTNKLKMINISLFFDKFDLLNKMVFF